MMKVETGVVLKDGERRSKRCSRLGVIAVILSLGAVTLLLLLFGYTKNGLEIQANELKAVEDRLRDSLGISLQDSAAVATEKFKRKMKEYEDCMHNPCRGSLQQLAYFYGDHDRFIHSGLDFKVTKPENYDSSHCPVGVMRNNSYNQYWCDNSRYNMQDYMYIPSPSDEPNAEPDKDKVTFHYWQASKFTHSNNKKENYYTLELDSVENNRSSFVKIKKQGIYIILAKVVFKDIKSKTEAFLMRDDVTLATCMSPVNTQNQLGHRQIPCDIFQMAYFRESAKISLKIDEGSLFVVRKTALFLGIMKMHDGPV